MVFALAHAMALLLLSLFIASQSLAKSLVLPEGSNHVVMIEGLERAAVASAKIVKVKAVPPSELLLTAKKVGFTTIQIWSRRGNFSYDVQVIERSKWEQLKRGDESNVVKVLLELVEIEASIGKELGINWPQTLQVTSRATAYGGIQHSGLNYAMNIDSAKGFVRQLVSEGWANVMARPELFVRLGEQASFHSGEEFPVLTAQSAYGTLQKKVDWKSYGLTVKVEPQSIDGLNIRSSVDIKISEPNPTSQGELPSLVKRELNTKINARDGETVLLSGLVRRTDQKMKAGVPFLSDIPLLGSLFFASVKGQKSRSEVMMAITFSLISEMEQVAGIEKMRSRVTW